MIPFEGYVRPNTVKRAYAFGRYGAFCGHARLSRAEFDSSVLEPHDYPSSLYRAYSRGFMAGRYERVRRLTRLGRPPG